MSETYRERLYDVEEVKVSDSLIAGLIVTEPVKLNAGEYKRGEILISSGEYFVKASDPSTLTSAGEICVLCRDITIPEGHETTANAYIFGMLNRNELILNGSPLMEYESSEIDTVIAAMRKHKLFVR